MATIMRNILEYLEKTAKRVPDKAAFVCGDDRITFSELRRRAAAYGMRIAEMAQHVTRRPVCVIGERNIDTLVCMLACVYSGNFYVPVDPSLPEDRIKKMLDGVDLIGAVCCGGERYEDDRLLFSDVYKPGTCGPSAADSCAPADPGSFGKTCSFDPLYGIFTSGTTGEPRLVVKSHDAMIRFIDMFTQMFGFEETDILGSQLPFYFDASSKDLFCCLKCGLTVHIIPAKYFSFPQFLEQCTPRTFGFVFPVAQICSHVRSLEPSSTKTIS